MQLVTSSMHSLVIGNSSLDLEFAYLKHFQAKLYIWNYK